MKRNILIVALLAVTVTTVQVEALAVPLSDIRPEVETKSSSFIPNEAEGAAKKDSPEIMQADGKAKRALCNQQERKSNPALAPIYFDAKVIFISGTVKAAVKELSVACEAATGKTAARVILEVPNPTLRKFPLLQKISFVVTKATDTILLKEQTTKCKVSDKSVSFILAAQGDTLQVSCGEEKKTVEDITKDYTAPPYDTNGNNTLNNDANGNGTPDQYDKSAEEAAAQGDTSQPSSQGNPYGGGQGLQQYNPYEYQYADRFDSEEEYPVDESLYDIDEEGGYGGQITDWRDETGTEGGKADSNDLYNPVLGGDTGTFTDENISYVDSFYTLPQDNSGGYIDALLSGAGEGSLDYAVWEAQEKATRDGWTPLDVSYDEYREYYSGASLTREQWDNWYRRLINPTDFEYNPGIDTPRSTEGSGGFFSQGWSWLISWFKGVNPTNKYYEI